MVSSETIETRALPKVNGSPVLRGTPIGDVKDPNSEVAKAIRERGGYPLMPEWDTQPANQYLPRRVTSKVGG